MGGEIVLRRRYSMKTYTGMEVVKILADFQTQLVAELGTELIQSLITFEHDEVIIYNPFLDETMRKEVDPIEYYGESFLKSEWVNYLDSNDSK